MQRFENPPYYITAYGLAVKRGFKGTLDEWIASLKGEKGDQGDKVELRYLEDKIQWRWIPDGGPIAIEGDPPLEAQAIAEEQSVTEDLTDNYEWHDLIDVAEIRGEIIEQTLDEAQQAAADAEQMATRASEAADTATAAQTAAEDAANAAETSETNAGNAETNARQSAQEAQTSADAAAASAATAAETAKSVNADEIQKEIEKRGNNLWRDPATGLLYLMSGEQKLGDGVEAGSGSGGLAFDSGYMDEEGYLHLTLQGEDIEDFEPFYVGAGGGGDDYGSTIKLTCSLDTTIFSILDTQESCVIPYYWSSVDSEDGSVTGPGTASWSVGGTRVAVQKVEQGERSFDIRPYLVAGTANEVLLTITDAYGKSRKKPFTITVNSFSLTWENYVNMAVYSGTSLKVNLTPYGSGDKVVKVAVDGVEVFSAAVSTTGRTVSTTIAAQSHGSHSITAWMEMAVEGETLKTDPLYHTGIWLEDGATTPIVGVLQNELTVDQYGTAVVEWIAVDPTAELTEVSLLVDGSTVSELKDVGRSVQRWAYKAVTADDRVLTVSCGGKNADVQLTVIPTVYDIAPVTVGLVMDIDPSGHSNNEADRTSFGYIDEGGVNHPFTFSDNFDWVNGGFQLDEDGVTAFVVKRGTYITADRSLFNDNAKQSGKEIKLIFKSMNVRNYDAQLISCLSGGVGFVANAQSASVSSVNTSMNVPYCEGKKIEMDVNIESENADRMAYICLKAIPSCMPVQYTSSDSWTQTDPALLTIGSEDADVWIYRMKLYDNSLNRLELLDNYIADCTDPAEMADRFLRNDIYTDAGTIDLQQLTGKNPNLRMIHLKAKRMTTGKSDKVTADLEMVYTAGGEAHHLIASGVTFKAQGTSSLEYILAALNLDVDFSTATSWTNGEGSAVTEYAFTPNSVPVNYFNLKANVASSESANNVCLADEYNSYNPYICAPRAADSRVRDCIEGHPCAVFFTNTADVEVELGARTVKPGETALYFMGDMNNSKKNLAVFGQDNTKYPKQCCVEILNNNNNPCLFRSADLSAEKWDGDGDFEFRFPENPTQEMKDAFIAMQAWVVSTTRDLATNAALAQAVTYNGVTYATDSAEYRAAKFVAELADYFVVDNLTFHYLFTERHGMMDNRAKNTFACYEWVEDLQDYRWSFRCNYDNDTAEGCDNSGGNTFSYGLEDTDMVGDSYAFNASKSTLWSNVRDLLPDKLLAMYINRKSAGAWDKDRILKKFRAYQSAIPEAIRIEDAWNKYFQPLLLAGSASYLKQCWGDKEDWREQYETYQDVYENSKYCDVSDRSDAVTLRPVISESSQGNITVTPYCDMYITVKYGNAGTFYQRAKKGVPCQVLCPADTLDDTETYVYNARYLTELSGLSGLLTKRLETAFARRLQILGVGSSDAGYSNRNLQSISLDNNKMLRALNLTGLPLLKMALDLTEHTGIEELYAASSGITGVTFTKGAPVRIVRLPPLGSLTALDLQQLQVFAMGGGNLVNVRVEDCPIIDTLTLCKEATGLARGRLTGVDWSDDNADLLTRLARLKGYDAEGKETDSFVLTGKAYCSVITQSEINTITAAFPDLELSYGQIVESFAVTFKNYDGTVLNEQHVRAGAAALNPVSNDLIDTPVKESSVYEVYTFIGWDTDFTNITADTVVTATFSSAMRYYTVNFWLDTSESVLLETQSIAVMASCTYGGATPAKDDGSVWAGWDKSLTGINQDLQVHALFVAPVLPDIAATGYTYLYSDNPDDISGYTAAEFWGILYNGRERDFFTIGDRIKLVCSTTKFTDTEIVLELRSFKHFMSAERANQFAGPYFGMVGLMASNRTMHSANSNAGGFPAVTMFTAMETTYYEGLPQFWKSIIEKIAVLSSAGSQSEGIVMGETHLTLESQAEVGFNAADIPYCNEVAEGADEVTFSCYTDNASRIKKTNNGAGSAGNYWLRSPLSSSTTLFCNVSTIGHAYSYSATNAFGVAFGFCLRSNIAE